MSTQPRWRRFLWQGGILLVVGVIAALAGVTIAGVVAVIGLVLLLVGLIGAAVSG